MILICSVMIAALIYFIYNLIFHPSILIHIYLPNPNLSHQILNTFLKLDSNRAVSSGFN
jgi:hypothetical protein